MGLCVSTSWCLVRHRLKGLAVKVFPASVFRCCFGSFCPLFTFIFFRWSTSTMELKAGDWVSCFRIFHFLTLKRSLVIFTVCFGLVSTYSPRHFSLSFAHMAEFELFPSSVTSSINTDTAPLDAMHNSAPSVHRWSCGSDWPYSKLCLCVILLQVSFICPNGTVCLFLRCFYGIL